MTADGGECAVRAVLDERAARYGPRTLMRIDGVDVSFVQMRERSIAAANVLRGHGVSPGDTIELTVVRGTDERTVKAEFTTETAAA